MWRLAVALTLGPGPDEVPAPKVEEPLPGIEFATEPPESEEEEGEEEGEAEGPAAQPAALEEPDWPTPGTAPPDGWGFVTAGAILMPTTALATWMLILGRPQDMVPFLITGSVLELMGIGAIAMGSYRQAKLRRWAVGYRVVARPQGSGLLAAGGIAVNFGAVLIASGALTGGPIGNTMIGVGVGGLAVIAPLTIYFGRARRLDYQATGGWYRPALPTVQLMPRLIVSDTTIGLGVAGRF
jgi:hypothetical protein